MILAKPAAQSFGYNFLGTYVHALNRENYARGANFAYSGASARADTTITPFYLKLQIDQYIYFKKIYQTPGYRTLFFLTLSLPMDGWQWQVYDDFEPLLRSNWFLQITCHSRKGLIATQLASFPSSMSFVTQIYFESIEVCCDWLRMWVVSPSSNRFVWAWIRCVHIQYTLHQWDWRQRRHNCGNLRPSNPCSNHIHDSSPIHCRSPRRPSGQIITHHLHWWYHIFKIFLFPYALLLVCFWMSCWCPDYPLYKCWSRIAFFIDTICASIIRISHFLMLVGMDNWQLFFCFRKRLALYVM